MLHRIMLWSVVVLSGHVVGCESGPRRLAASGTVTFKGAPLQEGTITFIPLTTTTQEGAVINNGKFAIPQDKGLAPGMYRVSISSIDCDVRFDPKKPPGPTGGTAAKERIPAEFNEKSKEEVRVTEAGPNLFEFKIP